MEILKRLFRGGDSSLNQLETLLIERLKAKLSPEAAQLLSQQVNAINLVQRNNRSREVCLYTVKNGKTVRNASSRFPNQTLELNFATIKFRQGGTSRQWTADFFSVRGYFFSIEFTPSPQDIDRGVELIDIHLHHDLMTTSVAEPALIKIDINEVQLPDWVREWNQRYGLTEPRKALSAEKSAELIDAIPAKLPADYLELSRVVEGVNLAEIEILGLSQIIEIQIQDTNFFGIAQVNGDGMIAVRKGDVNGQLYFLPYDGANSVALNTSSFREAAEALVAR